MSIRQRLFLFFFRRHVVGRFVGLLAVVAVLSIIYRPALLLPFWNARRKKVGIAS